MAATHTVEGLAYQGDSNQDLFESVYEQFFSKVYNYAYSCLGNRLDAEDATSVVFERVLYNLPKYDPGRAKLSTWIFCIAHRVVVDTYRRKARRTSVPLNNVTGKLVCSGDSPERAAIEHELYHAVLTALDQLSERERSIIALKFWGGLTNRHIAEVNDLTESNVAVIVFRALRRMRSILEQQGVQVS